MAKHARIPPVKRNDRVTLTITAMGTEGQGIGRVDGYTVFVPGALIGETVTAHILKAGAGFGIGKLMEVRSPSCSRVTPACPHHGKCGGCSLLHMDYAAQLSYKRTLVADALARIGGMRDIEVLPVLGMEAPHRYRNKASFPLANMDGRVELGFFAPRSHRVIPTEDCLLQREAVMHAARAVRDWANEYGVAAYDELSGAGLIRHVVAREGSTGEVMVTVAATGDIPQKAALADRLCESVTGFKSLYLNINKEDTNVILGEEYRLLYGSDTITERMMGLDFAIGPASFLQVNHTQAERAYACALDFLAPTGDELAVDAYCGVGMITLLLARRIKEAVGIEYVKQAVADAQANAQSNSITNARFLAGAAEALLPELIRGGFRPDAITLDPPRKGADAAFLNAALESCAQKLVYISCNPATLARDCAMLAEGGYNAAAVQPVDMFPNTPHLETVMLLQRIDT